MNGGVHSMMHFHQVLIVGGGTAGISVASQLNKMSSGLDIAIIDPAEKHYYQPLWTLVGAGVFPKQDSERDEASLIPEGVDWYQEHALEFLPEENTVRTKEGTTIHYKYLIVCPGIQINWGEIKGLEGNVGSYGICSNYSFEHVEYTWETIKQFNGGRAIFTHPNSPVKCGGAPQKIMYLAEDAFRKMGIRDQCEVVFNTANASIFSVKKYALTLESIVDKRNISVGYQKDLIEIDGPNKKALFKNLSTGEVEWSSYDMIHVVPYMSAPEFISSSPLANEDGWVDVDAYSLQHNKYENFWSW